MKEFAVRAKRMTTSSAVKMVVAWRMDQRASNEGKSAEHPITPSDFDSYRLGQSRHAPSNGLERS